MYNQTTNVNQTRETWRNSNVLESSLDTQQPNAEQDLIAISKLGPKSDQDIEDGKS